jgi:Zn-dependent protease with chaperone function
MADQTDAVYFDGQSNRKRKVLVRLGPALDIVEDGNIIAAWSYGDLRRVDSAPGSLRLMSLSALPLARLEIQDEALQQAIAVHSPALDVGKGGASQTLRIVVYSLAALASVVGLVGWGVPLLADRLAMVIPAGVERRLGEGVDRQVRFMFGGKVCENGPGRIALARLIDRVQGAAGIAGPLDVQVLATTVPNAFALPGGKVYVFDGLLQKATNADELAGVIAHELGHLQHRDSLRKLIQAGGSAFLVGLLFGDVLGGGAVLFAARSLLTGAYSRDAERSADAFAIDVMRKLGRSPKPMGELLLRITNARGGETVTILSSHPLTQERLAAMTQADQPAQGAALLSAEDWAALHGICR